MRRMTSPLWAAEQDLFSLSGDLTADVSHPGISRAEPLSSKSAKEWQAADLNSSGARGSIDCSLSGRAEKCRDIQHP